jgi:hypothetical protein
MNRERTYKCSTFAGGRGAGSFWIVVGKAAILAIILTAAVWLTAPALFLFSSFRGFTHDPAVAEQSIQTSDAAARSTLGYLNA